ncbi:uncharacterized protein LY89DRAFT_735741 [Mollisia scopiformis]|uniref:RRM domain-containing protein n=1 Tax=Mollisia scopiformis TaxID=149040 RepID=A0A194X397_MOLSC|nr:uncharacterized protein LY89DRAFT_735741 [Mollisia scopiformis]KUJ14663.1 hypothetical protein LY89DRAFT_735741 [Mollisia scopiformis]
MTSTHLDPEPPNPDVAIPKHHVPTEPTESAENSPSADSSFSDAYKEQPEVEEHKENEGTKQGSEVSDDYAMTFDSEGEGHADSQDISQAIIEPKTNSPLLTVSEIAEPSSSSSSDQDTTNGTQNGPATDLPKPSSSPSHPPNNDTPSTNAAEINIAETPDTSAESKPLIHDDASSEGIDIQQLLDNITANAERKDSANAVQSFSPTAATIPKSGPGLPTHSSLPPRPNVPQKRQYDDIQKYYGTATGLPQPPSSFRSPSISTSLVAAGAPGTSTDPRGGLPPPPTASFPGASTDPRGVLPYPPSANFRPPFPPPSPISPASYTQISRSSVQGNQGEADDLDAKWGPEIQRIYDDFLENERQFVTEGLWDRFPNGSRLFIGNLPSEKVTKRDIFHVFHPHGKIAQISIKQAYGFVQFYDSTACSSALQREQGSEIREQKIHLEISKPQKNTRNAHAASGRRSPDHSRGATQDRNGRSGQGRVDRYEPRAAPQTRVDEYGRPLRVRDDYRPARSPTPPRGSYRGREDYGGRGRDSYNGRDRRRSRSRSPPYGQREMGRYRERSKSPRSRELDEDASLQIPRRDPRDVPDVQIILVDQLDRNFISWVESEMRGRGIKVEVMFLSPRFPLQAVIRRQILEGVHAVSRLDMRSQSTSKIPLQVFDRQGGANNVRFDEYQDLDPKIAAELVLRAKTTQSHAPAQNVPYAPPPQYGTGQPYEQSVATSAVPNPPNFLSQIDNATLQQLLTTLNMPQQNAPAAAANSAIDLAGILGGLSGQPKPVQQSYQQASTDPYANIAANPALASFLANGGAAPPPQSQSQPPEQQSAQQVQNIMAQLARFRK